MPEPRVVMSASGVLMYDWTDRPNSPPKVFEVPDQWERPVRSTAVSTTTLHISYIDYQVTASDILTACHEVARMGDEVPLRRTTMCTN